MVIFVLNVIDSRDGEGNGHQDDSQAQEVVDDADGIAPTQLASALVSVTVAREAVPTDRALDNGQ